MTLTWTYEMAKKLHGNKADMVIALLFGKKIEFSVYRNLMDEPVLQDLENVCLCIVCKDGIEQLKKQVGACHI